LFLIKLTTASIKDGGAGRRESGYFEFSWCDALIMGKYSGENEINGLI